MEKKAARQLVQTHMHRYVGVKMADGNCFDGIVEHVDDYWVCLAVPGSVEPTRAFFPGAGFAPFAPGGFGFGFGPFHPFPRRFGRLVLPLAALTTLSLLPYYW